MLSVSITILSLRGVLDRHAINGAKSYLTYSTLNLATPYMTPHQACPSIMGHIYIYIFVLKILISIKLSLPSTVSVGTTISDWKVVFTTLKDNTWTMRTL